MAAPAAVGEGPVSTTRDIPGDPTRSTSKMVEAGAGMLQKFTPLKKIHEHLCAFHFYGYDMRRQVEAHHFCGHLNEEMRQCVIYDSPEPNARLIGVEYIISNRLFQGLPDEEKKLWHSHDYEVKSGVLILPGLPEVAERAAVAPVASTYGKVYHFWQFDRGDTLPLGPPQLMMSLTGDGQLDPKLAESLENRYHFSLKQKREQRKDIKGPEGGVHPLANWWEKGKGWAPEMKQVDVVSPQEKHPGY